MYTRIFGCKVAETGFQAIVLYGGEEPVIGFEGSETELLVCRLVRIWCQGYLQVK